uniref:Ixodegrin B n=1 Tax=Rhipicephalus zambeziensis TaxID=60191 RepID=A0A224YB20_9ACAR
MACFLVLVGAIVLCICRTSAAEGKGKEVGASCDGNEECGPEKCCFRPGPENGTVCGNVGEEGQPCSKVTLTEHSPQPSCREDEEAAGSNAPKYTHPYDGACPCKDGLTCDFSSLEERELGKTMGSAEKEGVKVQLGKCVQPSTLKEQKK